MPAVARVHCDVLGLRQRNYRCPLEGEMGCLDSSSSATSCLVGGLSPSNPCLTYLCGYNPLYSETVFVFSCLSAVRFAHSAACIGQP